ncbi:MAG: GNAT family N-acetyltransferase [Hyphomicrobiaceae bacterium]
MIVVAPYLEIQARLRCGEAIDAIFYEASNTQSYDSDAARRAFHWRWLGRYLAEEPDHAFLACDGADGQVCGYLVGSLADPAQRAEFAEIGYFDAFAELTAAYPAHLHINVAAPYRSQGVGGQLIDRFARHARKHGVNGMHVVTGAGMRNVQFYERLGFRERGKVAWQDSEIVLLGRKLA